MISPRHLWSRFERIHAVTYFADEAAAAATDAGYRGFWMGYFAQRAAPLGPVGPAVVTASFFGFHPGRVGRALPDAWAFAGPDRALECRLDGVDRSLRRLWGDRLIASDELRTAADLLWAAAQAAEARTGLCLPPAQAQICNVWPGKVTFIGDGDTVYVDIAGDGQRSSVPVRLTGAVEDLSITAPQVSPVRVRLDSGAKTVAAGERTLRDVEPGSTLTPQGWQTRNRYDVHAESRITLLSVAAR